MSVGTATKKRNWLGEATKTPTERAAAIVLVGLPGVGKSSLVGNCPGALALPFTGENTWSQLKAVGSVPASLDVLPPADTWADVLEVVDALTHEKHDHKALIIDTMNCAEKLLHAHVCERDFKGNMSKDKGFLAYGAGPEAAMSDWRGFLAKLDKMRDAKNVRVLMLAHPRVKNFKNPLGADYDRYTPDVNEKTWGVTHGWADAVLFANYFVAVDESGNRAKGKGGDTRLLHTNYSAAYDAKNRFNLPSEIEMGNSGAEGWANLVQAMKAGRK